MRFNLTILCILTIIPNLKGLIPTKRLDKISLNGKWFVDEKNRVVMLRGINAVKKSFPWLPNSGHIDMTNLEQLSSLKQWGFNCVRLGVMWAGLMPSENQINQTYLNEIKHIINLLGEHDIYVLIDLHQDMMSSKFNSYDGVPSWIVNKLPQSKEAYPWPFKDGKNLIFEAYLTESCSFAFQCLYNNASGFESLFQRYWQTVARNLKNFSNIVGYELINEPWAGDIYARPELVLPGEAGRTNLMPLYDRAFEQIRKEDEETLIFYEPVTWGVMSSIDLIGSGFDHPPGNDSKSTVFSWHFYCWLYTIIPNPLKNGSIPFVDRTFCDSWQLNDYLKTVEADMIKLGGGASFMTEFGGCSFDISNTSYINTEECEYILNLTDQHFQSWAYWESDFYLSDGSLNEQLIHVFSRVFPLFTNGIPKSLNYDLLTGNFSFIYQVNLTSLKDPNVPTEIFIPYHVYPMGFKVVTSDLVEWTFDIDSSRLLVFLKNETNLKSLNNIEIKINKIV